MSEVLSHVMAWTVQPKHFCYRCAQLQREGYPLPAQQKCSTPGCVREANHQTAHMSADHQVWE